MLTINSNYLAYSLLPMYLPFLWVLWIFVCYIYCSATLPLFKLWYICKHCYHHPVMTPTIYSINMLLTNKHYLEHLTVIEFLHYLLVIFWITSVILEMIICKVFLYFYIVITMTRCLLKNVFIVTLSHLLSNNNCSH